MSEHKGRSDQNGQVERCGGRSLAQREPSGDIKRTNEVDSVDDAFVQALDRMRPNGPGGWDARFVRCGGLGPEVRAFHFPEDAGAGEARVEAVSRADFYARHPFERLERKLSLRPDRKGQVASRFSRSPAGSFAQSWVGLVAGFVAVAGIALLLRSALLPEPVEPAPQALALLQGELTVGASRGAQVPTHAANQLKPHLAELRADFVLQLVTPNGEVPVLPGADLRSGDQLRFAYSTTAWSHLFVFGLDATGQFTPFYPDGEGQSLEVAKGVRATLPGAVELDEYVGDEWFGAVFSQQPVRSEDLRRVTLPIALGSHDRTVPMWRGQLPLPVPHEAVWVRVNKVAPQ